MTSRNKTDRPDIRRMTAELLRICASVAIGASTKTGAGAGAMRPTLRRLIILHPSNPKVLGVFITALGDLEEIEQARKWCASAGRVMRGVPEMAAAVAKSIYLFGDFDESVAIWRDLVNANPLQEWFRLGLAQALAETGPEGEVTAQLRRFLSVKPDTAVGHVQYARALQHRGRREEGQRALKRAMACEPLDQVNRVNIAWHHLRDSPDQVASWRAFGARWGGSPYRRRVNGVAMPCWKGPGDPAQRLLLRQEAGLGDQVLYSHFLSGLGDLGITGAMVAEPRLHRLFARSFGDWKIVGDVREISVSDFDAQIFTGDLGQHIHSPPVSPYLVPDLEKAAGIRTRYLDQGFKKLVGFAWRGGNLVTVEERRRAIPLSVLAQLFSNRDAGFVCLQHGVTRAERNELMAHPNVILDDMIDPLGDLDDLAAQISAMDLVVTGASANTHFAGALGLRVIALLPYVAHWHWGLSGVESPWYPRLEAIRQSQPGDWEPVLAKAAGLLRQTGGSP